MAGTSPTTFKLAQFNVENLFLFLDEARPRDWSRLTEKEWQKLSLATVPNKSLLKTLWLAETVAAIDADIFCLNEVGGPESLENFAKLFLMDRYQPFLIEGNSDRGIDVGYLVKRSWLTKHGLRAELRTHKHRPLGFLYTHEVAEEGKKRSHLFSRDCAELRLFSNSSDSPVFIVLAVHLKSKLDPDGIDPFGNDRRRAEANLLAQIYRELRQSQATPVIVAGDFNGFVSRLKPDPEFEQFLTTDLVSALDTAGLSGEDACTQWQFPRSGSPAPLQIDYIFMSPDLVPLLVAERVRVFRYLSDLKVPLGHPRTLDQRNALPSDHFPVIAEWRWPITCGQDHRA